MMSVNELIQLQSDHKNPNPFYSYGITKDNDMDKKSHPLIYVGCDYSSNS